jgi:hypothetical protein
MKHKYKEISHHLKETIKTPQRNLMSTIIFSTHELKLMNQNESCLSFLTKQNLKSNIIFYLSKSYSKFPLHKASDIAVNMKNALPRCTNLMNCYILNYYNLNDANPNVTNSNLLVLELEPTEINCTSKLEFFNFIFTRSGFLMKKCTEAPWMQLLVLDPVFLLKFKIPNSNFRTVKHAVRSDQNAMLVNAYSSYPTIGIFRPNPPNPDIIPLVGEEATRIPNWLSSDNSSSEENKS